MWRTVKTVAGVRVEVRAPTRGDMVQSVVTTGRVRPLRIRLAPIVSGTVTKALVKEGDRVVAGQALLQLDDREAKAAVANAEATLAQARADRRKLSTLSSGAADEAIEQARARLAEASNDYDRLRVLFAARAVTAVELERARTNLTLAQSVLRTALNQRQDLRRGGASVVSSDAVLAQATANLALARARSGYTVISAPVDGVVLTRTVEQGDALTANSQVMTLAATAGTELAVEPDERNLSLIAVGQKALASAEAFPDEHFEAVVSFIAPSVDSRRGTIEVRLTVADAPAYLRPDMTVSVDIAVARKSNAMVVPIGAVQNLASDTPSLLIVDGRRAVRRQIKAGIRDTERVEVLSGLDGSELVIQRPDGIADGARVRARVVAP